MYTLFVVLLVLAAVMLILVVLAQNPKSGGAGPVMGGGASNLMGVKRTTDILEKLTWGFIAAIMLLSIGSNFVIDRPEFSEGGINSKSVEKALEEGGVMPTAPEQTIPEGETTLDEIPMGDSIQ